MRLPRHYFENENVVWLARDLLGKYLMTSINGVTTGGMIVETEAYSWQERGCHAYEGKRTPRNEVMFQSGGRAYVYLCYGIHHLFNVVTNKTNVAEAVLIRAVEPKFGENKMGQRRGMKPSDHALTSGPGKLTVALGIDRTMNGAELWKNKVWIDDRGNGVASRQIKAGKRIGVDYAGRDANLPWRFTIIGNKWVSR